MEPAKPLDLSSFGLPSPDSLYYPQLSSSKSRILSPQSLLSVVCLKQANPSRPSPPIRCLNPVLSSSTVSFQVSLFFVSQNSPSLVPCKLAERSVRSATQPCAATPASWQAGWLCNLDAQLSRRLMILSSNCERVVRRSLFPR